MGRIITLIEFPFDAEPWWIQECLEDIFDTGNDTIDCTPGALFLYTGLSGACV